MSRYRVVGHSCESDHPNMRVKQFRVDGLTRGCEHVRIDTPLPEKEARAVAGLMTRAGLTPHLLPEETP